MNLRGGRGGHQRGPVPSGTLSSVPDEGTFSFSCGPPAFFGACLAAPLRTELLGLAALRGPPGGPASVNVPDAL